MITFIYPRGDWTAAEIAIKMQALAASQGFKVYSTPKNTRRDKEAIRMKLAKVRYALFMAYEVNAIDGDTAEELKYLIERKAEIYSVIPEKMEGNLRKLGMEDNIYAYGAGDYGGLIKSLEKTIKDIKTKESQAITKPDQQGDSDLSELLAFLAILGLILFFLWLVFSKE